MTNQIKKFKVNSNELWFWVYVYKDVESLRLDARSYRGETDILDCLAICQPVERLVIEPNKPEVRYGGVGIIRVLENVGGSVSAHELLHGAMHIYRLRHEYEADFGDNNGVPEEELCYILTDLVRSFNDKMYKLGFWK